MGTHLSPCKKSTPIGTKARSPNLDENQPQRVFRTGLSNKSVWAMNNLSRKLPQYPNRNPSTTLKMTRRKICLYSNNRSTKKSKFPAKLTVKHSCLKLPPCGSTSLKFTKSKKNSLKNSFLDPKARPPNFTWSIEISWSILTKKTPKGIFSPYERYLSKIACRRILRGDANSIMRIHEFL